MSSRVLRGNRLHAGVALPIIATAAMLISVVPASDTGSSKLPTHFGRGAVGSIVAGIKSKAVDNQAWFAAQDLHSKEKVFVSFNTTTSNLGIPVPHMLVIGVLPSGQGTLGVAPATFTSTQNPPSIRSSIASVAWVPAKHAYHITVNMPAAFTFTPTPGPFKADLWFRGKTGGAAVPTMWDTQTSYLPQSLGSGTANGTLTWPGMAQTTVHNWGVDAEPEYGTYLDGTDAYKKPDHIGYEWADAQNPDGSADLLLAFVEKSGVWRGLLSHTTKSGAVTECEPNVALSKWTTNSGSLPPNFTGFQFPQQISASCTSAGSSKPCLATTWKVSAHDSMVGPFVAYSFTSAMSAGSTTTPGSVAWIQHFREKGSFGQGPSFTSTGLHPAKACTYLAP